MIAKLVLIITDNPRAKIAIFNVVRRERNSKYALLLIETKIIDGGGSKYHFKLNKWKTDSQKANNKIITNNECNLLLIILSSFQRI